MATQDSILTGVPLDPAAPPPLNEEDQEQDRIEHGVEHLGIDSDGNTDGVQSEDEGVHFPGEDEEDPGYESDLEAMFLSQNRPSPQECGEEAEDDGGEAGEREAVDAESGDAETKEREKKKRSPGTAGLGSSEKKTKKRNSRFRIRKGTKFDTSDDERSARVEGLRHYYDRKEPEGSHLIAIVCKERCGRHFSIGNWGKTRRHYDDKDGEGNFRHHRGQPHDQTQFKHMSKVNADNRAKRCRDENGGATDTDRESESDVQESDYKGWNSVHGRPNADAEQVRKHTRTNKKASGDAPDDEDDKEDCGSGEKGESSECSKKCELLQDALRAAHTEVERLVGVIVTDRQQHMAEIVALCDDKIGLSPERAEELINNIHNINEDQDVLQYRWSAQIVP